MTRDAANRAMVRRVFDDHFDAISRYCHRRLPVAEANDAAAAVFAVVWRKVDRLPPEDEVLPWLYAVARNEVGTIRRSMRRLGRLRAKLDGQPVRHEPSPETVVVRNTIEEGLLDTLKALRPDDQEIIRLRAYEQLAHPEIAVVLGISVEAAKKRSARAMKRLRTLLGEAQPDSSAGTVPQQGGIA